MSSLINKCLAKSEAFYNAKRWDEYIQWRDYAQRLMQGDFNLSLQLAELLKS